MQQAEKIVAYLNGALAGTERQEFERRLAADPELQAAVSDYRTILQGFKGMRQKALQQEIEHWYPEDELNQEEALFLAYLEGKLDTTAAAAFERKLARDPELKQRLEAYQPLVEGFKGMQQEAFSREVAGWAEALPGAKEQPQAKVVPLGQKKNRNRRYIAAAAMLALVAVALWLLNPFGQKEFSYSAFRQDNYIEPAPDALVRGDEAALGAAARELAAGNYTAAATVLSAIPPEDDLFVTAQYLLGHSYYRTGAYQQAVDAFTQSLEPPAGKTYELRDFNRDNAAWTRILAQLALMDRAQGAESRQTLQSFLTSFLERADRTDTYYAKALELEKYLTY